MKAELRRTSLLVLSIKIGGLGFHVAIEGIILTRIGLTRVKVCRFSKSIRVFLKSAKTERDALKQLLDVMGAFIVHYIADKSWYKESNVRESLCPQGHPNLSTDIRPILA